MKTLLKGKITGINDYSVEVELSSSEVMPDVNISDVVDIPIEDHDLDIEDLGKTLKVIVE